MTTLESTPPRGLERPPSSRQSPQQPGEVWFQNRRARHLPKPAEPSVGQQHRRQHWQLDQDQDQHQDQNLYQEQNQYQHQEQNQYQHQEQYRDQNLYQDQHQEQHEEQNLYQDQAPHYPSQVRRIQTPDLRTPGSPLTLGSGPSPVPQQASCPRRPGHPGPGVTPAPLLWNLQEDYLCDLDFLEGWPIASPWSPVFTFGSSHHAPVLNHPLS
ncbi:hypothetical protein NDU88_004871 [Pleurodeles waltl]|uniref:Uncharacterized protein n=1 Tax=Pleurodeles waltl TaxID=8319 RepID=A0AAV7LAF7_PLEWA|nr:hypothetical protein NDU88_004871 [Pleurodeles waltl]